MTESESVALPLGYTPMVVCIYQNHPGVSRLLGVLKNVSAKGDIFFKKIEKHSVEAVRAYSQPYSTFGLTKCNLTGAVFSLYVEVV